MIIDKLNRYLNNSNLDDINHLIGKFIKKNINNIPNMTIDEIAKGCYVSKAKISSFCKGLGYDNFISFKDECKNELILRKQVVGRQSENLHKKSIEHIHDSLSALERNLVKIDFNKVEMLAERIKSSKYIFLYGVAYSYLLCQYIQYELDFLGMGVILMDENLDRNYIMKDNSIIIIVTVEGYAFTNNKRLMRKLKDYPCEKWIITTDCISANIIEKVDNSIVVPSEDVEVKDRRILIRYLIDIVIRSINIYK